MNTCVAHSGLSSRRSGIAMYVKIKCYRLKEGIPVSDLEDYDFKLNAAKNYVRTIDGVDYDYIIYYTDTKRFVFRICVWRESRAKKIAKYIQDLILDDLVEKVIFWEWLTIIGRWQDYPQNKIEKIEKRLNELNGTEAEL